MILHLLLFIPHLPVIGCHAIYWVNSQGHLSHRIIATLCTGG